MARSESLPAIKRMICCCREKLGVGKAILIVYSGRVSDLYCYLDLYPVEAFMSGTWSSIMPRPPAALWYIL